ncbi:MAG: glycosyltransferase family 2 protein [bacterium]|nr:glycosyltransferase family 2 protein [bacterium]
MKGLVILPVYNDTSRIKHIVRNIKLDVLIVNDGSEKPIDSVLHSLKPKKLISYKKNQGKGYALKQGFSYAIKNKYDFVITMDSDGEHKPEDINNFTKCIENYDFVIGERKIFRSAQRSFLNFLGGLSFKLLIPNLKDTQCGFRAIKTDLLKKLPLKCNGFEIETEMLLEAYKIKARFKSIPIKSDPRSFSNVKMRDYVRINNFFDSWVINNNLNVSFINKLPLMLLVYFGMVTGFVMKRIIR